MGGSYARERSSEYQVRGAIHYHAIIGRVPDRVRRLDYVDRWDDMAGYARIYAYERGKGAEFYLSKSSYAWKHGEIDLGGPLAERMAEASDSSFLDAVVQGIVNRNGLHLY